MRTSDAATTPPTDDIAILGGGASGVLTALQLLTVSTEDHSIAVHESSGVLGRGIAYGTSDPRHLLNVRARHMSAYADTPADLLDWARRAGRDPDPQGFLPRMEFSGYLQDTLADVADHRLTIRAGRVEDVVRVDGGFELRTRDRVSRARQVVLAYGNQPPAALTVDGASLDGVPGAIANPWDLAAIRALPDDATVVLVGTGLTAVDLVITFLADAPRRKAVLVSRHGWLPRAHIEQQSTVWVSEVPDGPLTADRIAGFVRGQVQAAHSHGVDWRNVVDGLRSATTSIWERLSEPERRRFLADHARIWEIHRHRMAPEVAARLASYRTEGRLRVAAGGLTGIDPQAHHTAVRLASPDGRAETIRADAIVNCTGPLADLDSSPDPLLQALRRRDLVAPDPLRLGLLTNDSGAVQDSAGVVVPGLFAVGPPRKGMLWESTAIPEIRTQAQQVAREVLARSGQALAPAG